MDIALGRVKNQRTERDLKAEKEKLQKKTEQDNTVKADEEKRRQDIAEFTAQYPTVTDFKTIPPEVWAIRSRAAKSLCQRMGGMRINNSKRRLRNLQRTLKRRNRM